jgi:Rod binding domain-containing protein
MIDEIHSQNFTSGLERGASGKTYPVTAQENQDLSRTKLKKAVKEFEALFIYELLKEMRQSTQGGVLGKGLGKDIYNSLFDMEVSRLMAGKGLGLGEMLLKQLEKRGEGGATPAGSGPSHQAPNFKIEGKGSAPFSLQEKQRGLPVAKGLNAGKDPKTASNF